MKGFIIVFSILTISLNGCEKEIMPGFKGTYTGRFIYTLPSSVVIAPASVTFNEKSYTASGGPNRVPAGGSGNLELINSETVKFNDMNVWTADFDWGLILNGEYNYQVNGDSLFLAKYRDGVKAYEYRLKRNNN